MRLPGMPLPSYQSSSGLSTGCSTRSPRRRRRRPATRPRGGGPLRARPPRAPRGPCRSSDRCGVKATPPESRRRRPRRRRRRGPGLLNDGGGELRMGKHGRPSLVSCGGQHLAGADVNVAGTSPALCKVQGSGRPPCQVIPIAGSRALPGPVRGSRGRARPYREAVRGRTSASTSAGAALAFPTTSTGPAPTTRATPMACGAPKGSPASRGLRWRCPSPSAASPPLPGSCQAGIA